jgi:hypothetical protein
MTAVNVPFRLKPTDICAGNAMPFQEHHEARVDRPLDDLVLHELFQNVQANLQVGDRVTICAYSGGVDTPTRQLMESGECRIVSKRQETPGGPSLVRAVWTGAIYKVPVQEQLAPPKQGDIKLSIKKEFKGGFTIRDERDNIIERVNTKVEAEQYIQELNGKTNAKSRAA